VQECGAGKWSARPRSSTCAVRVEEGQRAWRCAAPACGRTRRRTSARQVARPRRARCPPHRARARWRWRRWGSGARPGSERSWARIVRGRRRGPGRLTRRRGCRPARRTPARAERLRVGAGGGRFGLAWTRPLGS
jgi:hypothetical protein